MLAIYRMMTSLFGQALSVVGTGRARRGNELWQGRLGLVENMKSVDVWLHAASVGEVRVAANLIAWLKARRPELAIHLTTMTATGLATARAMSEVEAATSFFPYDTSRFVGRTLDILRPKAVAIAETEIWPNLIRVCRRREIPMLLVNGRMTERSFRRYRRFRGTLSELLGSYRRLFVKTEPDAERYRFLGAIADRVEVVGDMKFDAPLKRLSSDRRRELRNELGAPADGPLLVAGSTRPGEEKILLEAFNEIRKQSRGLRLVLAPRHVERSDEVAGLLDQSGFSWAVMGKGTGDVILVDRMGVLNDLYAAADLAFVGGTMVDIGGHNLLEPVWAGTPVLFGASLFNVQEAAEYILENKFGACVENPARLAEAVVSYFEDRGRYRIKEAQDLADSPTSRAGEFILSVVDHA